ncbi:MAG: hypothetical protein H7A24_08050 [Leptospiraceae bacterium]|nr:hypothetical protein [Leptospiraceae bacterium]MCP5511818.1 hypothetical protein [Leptospiraceae bacterium]
MKSVLRILISSLLIAFLLEISLRTIRPEALDFYWIQKQYHSYDPDYLVDLEPNVNVRLKHFNEIFDIQFSTNEFGFRGTGKIDNSLPQIGCIGDSVTMGFGVSDRDTFCSKINGYTDSRGQIYQSVNLGVDAYGPTAIARKMEKKLDQLNLKVLYYFPSNGDDIDEYAFWDKMDHPTKLKIFKFQFLASKYSYLILALKVLQEQLIFRFMETFVYPVSDALVQKSCIDGLKPEDECRYTSYSSILFSFMKDFQRSAPSPKDSPPIFPKSECTSEDPPHPIPDYVYNSTKEIVRIAEKRGIRIVFFLAPIDIETAYCSQRGMNHRLYNYSRTLKKFLIKENIEFIDLNEHTMKMKDSEGRLNPRPYYILGDGHYTALGNEWVYQILKEKTGEILK